MYKVYNWEYFTKLIVTKQNVQLEKCAIVKYNTDRAHHSMKVLNRVIALGRMAADNLDKP